MKTTLVIFSLSILLFLGCFNSSDQRVIIDKKIVEVVNKNIIDTLDNSSNCKYNFLGKERKTFFLNDTLYKYPNDSIQFNKINASWNSKNDTIYINENQNRMEGAGDGFRIKIFNNDALITAYLKNHFLIHNYSNKPDGKLSNLVTLPVVYQELILSKLPFEKTDIIHGYLEFHTDEFYIFKDKHTENPTVETIGKYNSKIYFKARYCSKK